MTADTVAESLSRYRSEVEGRVPARAPVGAVVEASDGLVRVHYATYGTVEHGELTTDDHADLVAHEQRRFTEHRERVGWRVPDHAPARLAAALLEAGFTAGPTRTVLAIRAQDLPAITGITANGGVTRNGRMRQIEARNGVETQWLHDASRRTGPHRRSFDEAWADGRTLWWEAPVFVVESDGRLVAAMWGDRLDGTSFAALNGFTAVRADLLAIWREWAIRNRVTFLMAEVEAAAADVLVNAGFHAIATVRSYQWSPGLASEPDRPVSPVHHPEYDTIWDAFGQRFAFRPGVQSIPAITEPTASVTWHLDAVHQGGEDLVDEVERILRHGLLACTRPGEQLYWLDWQHQAYRFDPRRVGITGRPPWTGAAFPDGDYYIYLTPDLRIGTFGHPWEPSLCVFGAELLDAVETDLTALLGRVLRRGGHNVENRWTYDAGT